MTLHPIVKNGNKYCGPSALSAILGIDTGKAAALIRHVGGRKIVKGTFHGEMRSALSLAGYATDGLVIPEKRPTLKQWHRMFSRNPSDLYLVSVGGHYAVLKGTTYSCGMIKTPVKLKESPKYRSRVRAAWRLRKEQDVDIEAILPAPTAKSDLERKDRTEAKRLAAEYGITIEVDTGLCDRDMKYVTCAAFDDDTDPCYGDHYGCGWWETLSKVKTYVEAIKARPAAAPVPAA